MGRDAWVSLMDEFYSDMSLWEGYYSADIIYESEGQLLQCRDV